MIKRSKGLFSYIYNKTTGITILNPNKEEVLLVPKNPVNGNEWEEQDAVDFANSEVNTRNKELVKNTISRIIDDISVAYVESMTATITLSDGNLFGPAKSVGENPTYSLQNTLDLIKNGCEYALMKKAPSITLSDANNKNVVYTFDAKSTNPIYITPVLEIADYLVKSFGVKQHLRTYYSQILELEDIDLDELESLDAKEEFKQLLNK